MEKILKIFKPHKDFEVDNFISYSLLARENGKYSIRLIHEFKNNKKHSEALLLEDLNSVFKVIQELDRIMREKRNEKSSEEIDDILDGLENWKGD